MPIIPGTNANLYVDDDGYICIGDSWKGVQLTWMLHIGRCNGWEVFVGTEMEPSFSFPGHYQYPTEKMFQEVADGMEE
jgi:hypothetical protein